MTGGHPETQAIRCLDDSEGSRIQKHRMAVGRVSIVSSTAAPSRPEASPDVRRPEGLIRRFKPD
jgi:hypothetical protein